jgi:glycosyltransferase involved in cell wall biosynthesis
MPKIGMICYFDPDTYPGVYNSCNILAEQGWSVDVVCLEQYGFGGKIFDSRVWLHRIENRPGGRKQGGSVRFAKLICKARVVGRERKWDIAIGHDMHGFAAARLSKVLPPSRIAFWSQDLPETSHMSLSQRILFFLKKKFLTDCPLAIAPSYTRAEGLKKLFTFNTEPQVVYNSPRLNVAVPNEGWRAKLGIGADVPVVVYAGGLGRDRFVPEIVESVALWPKPSVLILAGYGQRQMVEELRTISCRSGTRDRVYFVGHLPSIMGLVREAQLGVSFSSSEEHIPNLRFRGIASNKIFEYLALGIPAVVSYNEESSGFMEAHRCGVCVGDHSPRGIAQAISSILRDPEVLINITRNAKKTHQQNTNFERRFCNVLETIRKMIPGEQEI